MQVTFYGVRGSIPAPGAEYIKYGGNTACTYIKLTDGTHLILDAGTGIKKLGYELEKHSDDINILLTHNHWDHIQGFPFFTPAYQKDRQINIALGQTHISEVAILDQMSRSFFPVEASSLPSKIAILTYPDEQESITIGNATITRRKLNHPGGGSGYIIDDGKSRVAYITDNELYPPSPVTTTVEQWIEFVKGVDLLIHDAQYQNADMPRKLGWGHSIAQEALQLAIAAEVKSLALYSYDHIRTDDEIDQLVNTLTKVLQSKQSKLKLIAACEHQMIQL